MTDNVHLQLHKGGLPENAGMVNNMSVKPVDNININTYTKASIPIKTYNTQTRVEISTNTLAQNMQIIENEAQLPDNNKPTTTQCSPEQTHHAAQPRLAELVSVSRLQEML